MAVLVKIRFTVFILYCYFYVALIKKSLEAK